MFTSIRRLLPIILFPASVAAQPALQITAPANGTVVAM